jgi:membrane protein DedA with SNARE-associated domain
VLIAAATALAASPQPQLPGFLNLVGGYLHHYGYGAIFLLVMLEDFGIPVPGETILIAGAIFAGAGTMNVLTVAIVGFLAAVLGDNIGFGIGHFGGRALALRWGKYVFLTPERLDKAEVFFNRHGGKIIVVARFIEGLRQANGIVAGITGMRWLRFLVFNALGAALWVGTWVSVGYFAGQHIGTVYHYITVYSYYVLIAVVVLVAALIIRHVLRRRRRKAAEANESTEVSEASAAAQEDAPAEQTTREHVLDEAPTPEQAPAEIAAQADVPGEGERVPEGQAAAEAAVQAQVTEDQAPAGTAAHAQVPEDQAPAEQVTEGHVPDERVTDERVTDERVTDHSPERS